MTTVARQNENSPKPLSAPGGSQQVTSGTALPVIGHKLVVVVTVSGNLSITTLDNTTVTLTGLPVGVFTFDVQHQLVSWTGTMTAASFYRLDG